MKLDTNLDRVYGGYRAKFTELVDLSQSFYESARKVVLVNEDKDYDSAHVDVQPSFLLMTTSIELGLKAALTAIGSGYKSTTGINRMVSELMSETALNHDFIALNDLLRNPVTLDIKILKNFTLRYDEMLLNPDLRLPDGYTIHNHKYSWSQMYEDFKDVYRTVSAINYLISSYLGWTGDDRHSNDYEEEEEAPAKKSSSKYFDPFA